MNKNKNNKVFILVLIITLLATMFASLLMGRYSISSKELLDIISNKSLNEPASIVLLQVRLSRILAAVMIGAALSMSGAAYQGVFRNPMVSPDILGASAGAGFGASLAILLGLSGIGIQLIAFTFGLLSVAITYYVSGRISGGASINNLILILTGTVVGSLFMAFVSMIKYVGDPYDTLPAITFWLMGGLTYITNDDILVSAVPFIIGAVIIFSLRWRINVLSLSTDEAQSLGLDTTKLRGAIIIGATLMSSSAVAIGGMIGWIGLITPHLARMLVGSDYKNLLPTAMLIGSIFLLIVDNISRTAFAQELPLGILTAIIGTPFFLYLLSRVRGGIE